MERSFIMVCALRRCAMLSLAFCRTAQSVQHVAWTSCVCGDLEGYGTCTRTIPRGASENHNRINLILTNCNIAEIRPGDFNLPNARSINLQYNNIERVGEDVFQDLTTAEYISLEYNKIRGEHIHPDAFKNCRLLVGVGFNSNDMRNAPTDLLKGIPIKELYLSNTLLDKVPIFVTRATNVVKLTLANNDITLKGSEFALLTRLKYLSLHHNRIESIPETIFENLADIELIDLSFNKITYISSKLFTGLTKLKDLHLQDNLIENLSPNTIKDFMRLKTIDISGNKFNSLPEKFFPSLHTLVQQVTWTSCVCEYLQGFGKCTRTIPRGASENDKRINLMLTDCNITEIRPGDFNLPNARWINLQHNNIERIGEDVFKDLTTVEYISLEYNKIRGEDIHPDAFKNCRRLDGVSFNWNDMRNAPTDLLKEIRISHLYLRNTLLVEVPIFATRATNVWKLILANNYITLKGSEFALLTRLKNLSLHDNRIESIPETIFKNLADIELIDLSFNKITFIPSKLFHGLTKLKYLYLDNNLIENLSPNTIKDWMGIQIINISRNKFNSLPEYFLPSLQSLNRIDFSENPWQCGHLNQLLIGVKKRKIEYNSDHYNGRIVVCEVVRF